MNKGDLVRCYVHPDKFIHKSKIKDIVGVLISHKRFKSKITKNWDNEFQVLSQGKIQRVTTELYKIEKIEAASQADPEIYIVRCHICGADSVPLKEIEMIRYYICDSCKEKYEE